MYGSMIRLENILQKSARSRIGRTMLASGLAFFGYVACDNSIPTVEPTSTPTPTEHISPPPTPTPTIIQLDGTPTPQDIATATPTPYNTPRAFVGSVAVKISIYSSSCTSIRTVSV